MNARTSGSTHRCSLPDLPPRPRDAHKGTFGSVLIVAGSRGMSGAACLAGQAALHGGAGLVTVAVPESVGPIVSHGHASYMTVWLPEEDGRLKAAALPDLETIADARTAVALGPGLGQAPGVQLIVKALYERCQRPMVVDADGLNAFAGSQQTLKRQPDQPPRILTPHPGEFSRLLEQDTRVIQQNREDLSVRFAREHGVVLLLKGTRTVITDGNQLAVNATGSAALATGGSGDVLTGLIAALLAQGMGAFEAAQLAAHLHGLAGEAAGTRYSDRFVSSMEILLCLSDAWKMLEAESQT